MNSPVVPFAGKVGDSTEISVSELFTPPFYSGRARLQDKSVLTAKYFSTMTVAMSNWIRGAVKNKGALHRQLGFPKGQRIPSSKLRAAAAKGGTLGRRARLAQTLSRLRK